jgi:hypothetical protein
MLRHSGWPCSTLLRACLAALLLASCNSDDGAAGSADGGTPSSRESQVAGIDIPNGLPRCSEAVVAQVTNLDVSFRWTKVSDANQYAVHVGLLPGLDPERTVLQTIVSSPSFVFTERNRRGRYRFVGFALRDKRALCMLAGPTIVEPD